MTAASVVSAAPSRQGTAPATLPQLLRDRASEAPDRPALRHKRHGIWHSVSWSSLAEQVAAVAAALNEFGVRPGDIIAIVSDNRPEWLVVELAAQSLRAAIMAPHPECGADELAALLDASGATLLVVEDQYQLEKAATGGTVPTIAVTCLDARGISDYRGTEVNALVGLMDTGRRMVKPGWWEHRLAECDASDVALLALSSRASATPEQLAAPEFVRLTHANLLASSGALQFDGSGSADLRWVSVLPLGWVWEQVAGVAAGLRAGFALNFPEGPATQRLDLRDIGPDVLLAPARVWEDMAAELQEAADEAGRARSRVLSWAMDSSGPQRRLADAIVLRSVRDRLGLSRLREAWSFGAPLRGDVHAFFTRIGVDLRNVYGADAAGGPIAAVKQSAGVGGAVSAPLPGVEVRVSGDGEILVRSPGVSADAVSSDGWLHTGDRGAMRAGQMMLVDRVTDVLDAAGTMVSCSEIEARLRGSRYIEDAVILSTRVSSSGLAALVVLDPLTIGSWAEQRRLVAPNFEAMTRLPEVGALVLAELANIALPAQLTVRRCVILSRRLDPELGEVTRTLVVRRRVVLSHFKREAAALASGRRAGSRPGAVPVLELPEETS